MDRITRGFHRLGLALAAPLLLIAVYCLGASALAANAGSHEAGLVFWYGVTFAAGAAVTYGTFRLIAWVINGFRETRA